MFSRLKERMTYANVASTAALVIAVGGGGVAVAASVVPHNSVGTRQVINNSLRSVDIKDDALKGFDINESTLGQVPDAVHANNADNANNANTANSASTASTANSVASGGITSPDVFGPGDLGIVRAYAWNNLINTNGTLSGNGYTYNRSGGSVTVTHNSAGNYTVTFTGLNLNGGNYQVSGYGGGSVWCKVSSWGANSAGVLCFNSAGAATDSLFTIAAID
jgi:hypothetical protein